MQDFEISPEILRKEPHSLLYTGKHRRTGAKVLIKKFPFDPDLPDVFSRELLVYDRLGESDHLIRRLYVINSVEDDLRVDYIVFEPLYTTLHAKINSLPSDLVKKLLLNLLQCVDFCHSKEVIHRSLNPSSLLLGYGQKTLKIGDAIGHSFTFVGETERPGAAVKEYMAPEILMGADYSTPVDIWAVGCIFAEMVTGKMLFYRPVPDDVEEEENQQLYEIFRQVGTPTLDQWPELAKMQGWQEYEELAGRDKGKGAYYDFRLPRDMGEDPQFQMEDDAADLLMKMLTLNPQKRITAKEAMEHPYFKVPEPSPWKSTND